MADQTHPDDGGVNGEVDVDGVAPELAARLGDADVWAEVPFDLEDAIVAAITEEAEGLDQPGDAADEPTIVEDPRPAARRSAPPPDNVVELTPRRRSLTMALSAAAAVVLLLVGAVIGANIAGDDGEEQLSSDVDVALTATDLAPGASADVGFTATPLGTRIILAVRDVPPAPEGFFYEAWMRVDAEIGVSAGTFHLRGGDGEIELWSGVSVDDYPLFTITIQEEGAGAASSGRVILRGVVDG